MKKQIIRIILLLPLLLLLMTLTYTNAEQGGGGMCSDCYQDDKNNPQASAQAQDNLDSKCYSGSTNCGYMTTCSQRLDFTCFKKKCFLTCTEKTTSVD